MIMQTSLNLYLEMRLNEWARWFKEENRINLGYPHQSSICMGSFNKVYEAVKNIYEEEKEKSPEEQMGDWVMDLGLYNKDLADVIKTRYLTFKKLPIHALARKLNISHRTFEDRLKLAKNFLISRLIIFSK